MMIKNILSKRKTGDIKMFELAKKYGIYGFCFYHYWFKDGRQILEKPAENLLQWKDMLTVLPLEYR